MPAGRWRVLLEELLGHVATELEVFGLIHHTHAPAANLSENAVMGNCLPYGLGGCGHWRECYDAIVGGSISRAGNATRAGADPTISLFS